MIKEIIHSIFPVSDTSIQEFEKNLEFRALSKGEVFIQKDKRNDMEYFVLEGVCKSYLCNPEGEEITISFFNEKSVLSPFTTRTSLGFSTMNFKALTNVKLAYINATVFEQLMISNLEIRHFANEVLRIELMKKVEKEIGLASFTAKERLIRFRQQYALLENLIPHTDIATYLGITNISLSRLRKELLFE
jgi:CRP-like cAMP-binding protein